MDYREVVYFLPSEAAALAAVAAEHELEVKRGAVCSVECDDTCAADAMVSVLESRRAPYDRVYHAGDGRVAVECVRPQDTGFVHRFGDSPIWANATPAAISLAH